MNKTLGIPPKFLGFWRLSKNDVSALIRFLFRDQLDDYNNDKWKKIPWHLISKTMTLWSNQFSSMLNHQRFISYWKDTNFLKSTHTAGLVASKWASMLMALRPYPNQNMGQTQPLFGLLLSFFRYFEKHR